MAYFLAATTPIAGKTHWTPANYKAHEACVENMGNTEGYFLFFFLPKASNAAACIFKYSRLNQLTYFIHTPQILIILQEFLAAAELSLVRFFRLIDCASIVQLHTFSQTASL